MTGIILLDKPNNMTSFSAVNRVRRLLSVKKAGHTGTLDPMATGVLPIALSNCTRFIDLLPVHDKGYAARARLGVTTDTLDSTGTVLSENEVNVTREQLENVLKNYVGKIKQIPPMYSAISKDGKRLYELARQGIEIEREAREITVYSLTLDEFSGDSFSISVECSAGTYIRSLIDDIGKDLGCGAVMTALRRTSANGFSINNCVTLEELEKAVNDGTAEKYITPIERCFDIYPEVFVTEGQAKRFSNGGELSRDRLKDNISDGIYRVYSPDRQFLGLGEIEKDGEFLKVRRVYVRE